MSNRHRSVLVELFSFVEAGSRPPGKMPPQDADETLALDIPAKWVDHDCYVIAYLDSSNAASTRRIAVKHFDGLYIHAHCFERDAARTFRADRVQAVYDFDGVEIEPTPFPLEPELAEEIDAGLDYPATREPYHYQPSPEQIARNAVDAEVTILRILALCDGRAAAKENDVIAAYAYKRFLAQGLEPGGELRERTASWIRRFYPDRREARVAIGDVATLPEQDIIALLRACRDVIKADGRVHEKELLRFRRLCEEITSARREIALGAPG